MVLTSRRSGTGSTALSLLRGKWNTLFCNLLKLRYEISFLITNEFSYAFMSRLVRQTRCKLYRLSLFQFGRNGAYANTTENVQETSFFPTRNTTFNNFSTRIVLHILREISLHFSREYFLQ